MGWNSTTNQIIIFLKSFWWAWNYFRNIFGQKCGTCLKLWMIAPLVNIQRPHPRKPRWKRNQNIHFLWLKPETKLKKVSLSTMRPLKSIDGYLFSWNFWTPMVFFQQKNAMTLMWTLFFLVVADLFGRGRWSAVSISMICQSRSNRSRRSRWGENSLFSGMVQVEGTLIPKSWRFFFNSEFKKLSLH